MKVKVLKPCIINGKSHKPGKKEVTVSKKDGDILVSLGKVVDLTPKKEPLTLNIDVNMEEFEAVKTHIAALESDIVKKDEIITSLQKTLEGLTSDSNDENEEKGK